MRYNKINPNSMSRRLLPQLLATASPIPPGGWLFVNPHRLCILTHEITKIRSISVLGAANGYFFLCRGGYQPTAFLKIREDSILPYKITYNSVNYPSWWKRKKQAKTRLSSVLGQQTSRIHQRLPPGGSWRRRRLKESALQ